jgi:hypothetical protein
MTDASANSAKPHPVAPLFILKTVINNALAKCFSAPTSPELGA